jgi:uncharacterized protein (TIGR02246 family)
VANLQSIGDAHRSSAMMIKIRSLFFAGLFIGVSALCCSRALMAQEQTSAARNSDRDEIMAILKAWEDAWNRHDMRAFGKLFHEDGVWVLWTGQIWTGRTAIEEGHAAVHRTVFRNSVQRERLEELTFVGPDAAVVRFYSTLTGDERYPDKLVRSRKILVVTRRADGWKVGWGQNTRFADTAADAPERSTPR